MPRKVFISVLGFTNYGQCSYVKDNFKSDTVRFIQEATLDYLCQKEEWTANDIAYILLTREAEMANWLDDGMYDKQTKETVKCQGLQSRLLSMRLPFEVQAIKSIPHGNSEAEIWEIFERVFLKIQEGDELYFDLTHGFRYLPMLVMVLINYSKFLCGTTVRSITYGNYESRNVKNEAPIIDLLPLSALQDWTFAAGQYLDSGNVNRLVKMSKETVAPILKNSEGRDENAKTLIKFIRALENSIDDIQMCRGINIVDAINISEVCNTARMLSSTCITPLNPIFDKIKQTLKEFVDYTSERNGFAAAKWCIENNLYQQAITIARENIVTYVCLNLHLNYKNEHDRNLVDRAFYINEYNTPELEWKIDQNSTPEEQELDRCTIKRILENKMIPSLCVIFNKCRDIRNDINHFGMRNNPSKSIRLKEKIKTIVREIYELYDAKHSNDVNAPIIEMGNKLLLNITNHPSNQWDENQLKAAAKYGQVVDISFPKIDENADESYISELADEYLAKILAYTDVSKDVTVHIMGEFNFTFSLLKRLQQYGITCVASTSKRIVQEISPGNKEVCFKFERFRKYE